MKKLIFLAFIIISAKVLATPFNFACKNQNMAVFFEIIDLEYGVARINVVGETPTNSDPTVGFYQLTSCDMSSGDIYFYNYRDGKSKLQFAHVQSIKLNEDEVGTAKLLIKYEDDYYVRRLDCQLY